MTAAREDRRRLAPSRGKRSRQRWWLSYGVLHTRFWTYCGTSQLETLSVSPVPARISASILSGWHSLDARSRQFPYSVTVKSQRDGGVEVKGGQVEKMEISKHCQDPESGTTMFLSVRILSISYTIAVPKVPSVVVDFGWHPRGVQEKRGVQETTTINDFGRTSQPPPSNSGTAHFFCRDGTDQTSSVSLTAPFPSSP